MNINSSFIYLVPNCAAKKSLTLLKVEVCTIFTVFKMFLVTLQSFICVRLNQSSRPLWSEKHVILKNENNQIWTPGSAFQKEIRSEIEAVYYTKINTIFLLPFLSSRR